jgi:hypothetical protein
MVLLKFLYFRCLRQLNWKPRPRDGPTDGSQRESRVGHLNHLILAEHICMIKISSLIMFAIADRNHTDCEYVLKHDPFGKIWESHFIHLDGSELFCWPVQVIASPWDHQLFPLSATGLPHPLLPRDTVMSPISWSRPSICRPLWGVFITSRRHGSDLIWPAEQIAYYYYFIIQYPFPRFRTFTVNWHE